MLPCDAMDRYYRSGEFQGNVLPVWRDWEAEELAAAGPMVTGECDAEIAECALETYLCAQQDGFRRHPEFRAGVEVRCENRQEAAHMTAVMTQITQDTVPYQVTWIESRPRG